ncbi:hypothetical protein IW261DRAFT_1415590 [Armillaria novae-zelandiae]|uniref:Uncharacterized protein n=1 Tax=Armillaria novae-zelandiae TaxID=153914 RepID=A0AA39UJN8_9AGAR|nr:hypothetical protein IW261DRAFT_1415590 [Armillaria novae-zelandiae]
MALKVEWMTVEMFNPRHPPNTGKMFTQRKKEAQDHNTYQQPNNNVEVHRVKDTFMGSLIVTVEGREMLSCYLQDGYLSLGTALSLHAYKTRFSPAPDNNLDGSNLIPDDVLPGSGAMDTDTPASEA